MHIGADNPQNLHYRPGAWNQRSSCPYVIASIVAGMYPPLKDAFAAG